MFEKYQRGRDLSPRATIRSVVFPICRAKVDFRPASANVGDGLFVIGRRYTNSFFRNCRLLFTVEVVEDSVNIPINRKTYFSEVNLGPKVVTILKCLLSRFTFLRILKIDLAGSAKAIL